MVSLVFDGQLQDPGHVFILLASPAHGVLGRVDERLLDEVGGRVAAVGRRG